MTHDLFSGFSQLLTPEAIGLLIAGMAIGMFMGMLPGLGVSLALSLMLPFLYHMSVIPAITLMLATQASSYYAASITAILLNTPGAPESYPTTLDGFPMAQRGEAGRALAISAASTWAGGWIGCVVLLVLIPVSGSLVNLFHPPEFVAIIILALVLIGGTGESTSSGKVVLSGAIGLMLSFIGSDPVTGIERFTFGNLALTDGLNVVPFALGVFAMTQMVVMFGRNQAVAGGTQAMFRSEFRRQVGQGLGDAARSWVHILRSALVASVLGLIPGIGGFSANFISYSLGRQVSRKHGSKFGTGVPAGIASAEGSSLAKEVGSLVPAVALGLPSGVGMVIFIAALTILGIQPGPTLLKAQPSLPYTMLWIMAIAGLLSCVVGLIITPWISRATNVRGPVMMPVIVSLALLGSFAAVTSFAGVVELGVFAAIGVVLRKLDYSLAAMTIGLVLGGTFADNLHLTQTIYGWGFITRSPLADIFLVISIVLLGLITWRGRRGKAVITAQTAQRAGRQPRQEHTVLEPAAEAVIAVVSVIYMIMALGYGTDAGAVPAIIAAIAAVISVFRLASRAIHALLTRASGSRQATPALADTALAVVPAGAAGLDAGPDAGLAGGGGGLDAAVPAADGASAAGSHEGEPPGPAEGASAEPARRRRRMARELAALGWIWAAIAASYLFGFEIGGPLAAAAYCLTSVEWSHRWARLSYTVVVTGLAFGIAYGFISLFNLTFTGLLT
ncbi:MAG TPA: tripartite tricarboxylate transporter permease [Trebonia sp.]|nr:tripartite tricarboxylate transporter permease [Trebonia sp.]